jgi:plasmid stability protein
MAVLNIRNLPRKVHTRLRIRAAKANRSMEAEARAILTEACMKPNSSVSASALQEWVDHLYRNKKPRNVVDVLIAERRRESSRE